MPRNLELIKKTKVEMVTARENVESGAAPDHSSHHEQSIPGQAVLA